MRPANPVRGEVTLALPSGLCLLRPSFQALVAAEADLGSLFAVLERAAAGETRIGELAALLWHCRAEPGATDRSKFEEELLAAGLAAVMPAFRTLLSGVFGGRG